MLKFSTQIVFKNLKRYKLVYCVSLHSIFLFHGCCPHYMCSVRHCVIHQHCHYYYYDTLSIK
jgi:hypothetical protein